MFLLEKLSAAAAAPEWEAIGPNATGIGARKEQVLMVGPSTEDAKPQGNSPESLSRATQNTRKVMVSFMVE